MSFARALLLAALLIGFGFATSVATAGEPKKDPPKKEEAKKDDKPKKDPKDMNADEAEEAGLCPVKKNPSKPVYHADYKDKTYHFCSRACQKDFSADPAKFGAAGKKEEKK